jgi:hydrogenase expression/formation protein HypE
VGYVPAGLRLHPGLAEPGDVLLINGPVGDHGLAVMLAREMPGLESAVRSDAAPLNGLVRAILDGVPPGAVRFMRDPTRGGLAGAAADLAARSGWHVVLDEEAIPVRPETRHAAEMLGLDWLDIANEGKLLVLACQRDARAVLAAMQEHPSGRDARPIGRIEGVRDSVCELRTAIGGRRILQKPYGEQLPRIC